MIRTFLPAAAVLGAGPAAAHEASGFPHLHPHGGEALLALGVLAVAAYLLLRALRTRG